MQLVGEPPSLGNPSQDLTMLFFEWVFVESSG